MDHITWEDVKTKGTCYIINLDHDVERFAATSELIKKAGFCSINRFRAVDANNDDLTEEWARHGNPAFGEDPSFTINKGEQGCCLSHLNVWLDIIERKLPYAVIFEDDIMFHKLWHAIVQNFYKRSPKDFDILFMGSQIDNEQGVLHTYYNILQLPVYCLHAYIITLEGAKRLYDYVINNKNGIYAIDCMLRDGMCMEQKPFSWYVWNGMKYPDENRGENHHWIIRNTGLVYQDEKYGSNIKQR